MFRTLSPLPSSATFYLLAFAMVVAVALTGGTTAAAMLTPAVAVALMLLLITRQGWTRDGWASLGLHRLGLGTWPVAILLPLLIVAVGAAVVLATDAAHWQYPEQAANYPAWTLPAFLLANIAYASLTTSLTEEIGWRGYLLPRLTTLGVRRALLLSGLLHGIWHLPVMLLTSLYHPVGSRLVVVPMFLVAVTALGVFYGWLRLRTDSIWPAVLAHSAHNVAVSWMSGLLVGNAVVIQYVAGEGVVTTAAYVAVAVVLLKRAKNRQSLVERDPSSSINQKQPVPAAGR
ncbi:MAG TPA: type II CAAX endopeptidase family protein [Propionibacteriaceae bacterium]